MKKSPPRSFHIKRTRKIRICIIVFLFCCIILIFRNWADKSKMKEETVSLYEYYTADGIFSGLQDYQPYFTLNFRNITLYSGAIHYFRVPPEAWRDRLRKARAAGLNVVETYMPWNLHEPQPDVFEWGSGKSGSDFAQFLNIEKFLKIAQDEDLFVIVRPGPYICSEWDFGGLPSWLLREQHIKVRTSDEKFMKHVRRYFNELLPLLAKFQFTKGGPIIAFQIENEYGSTGSNDKEYLYALNDMMDANGIVELRFTSDSATFKRRGAITGVLQTVNFQIYPEKELAKLKQLQPNKPLMVMEFWTGWFDHWSEKHNTRGANNYEDVLRRILEFPASVNLYMFHGGTNWGFLNGANVNYGDRYYSSYQPDTTSYDYDAPLTEAGDYTEKYYRTRDLIQQLTKTSFINLPHPPALVRRIAYRVIPIIERMSLEDLEYQITNKVNSPTLISMENLPINNNTGQQYGYIIYKHININIPPNSVLKILGRVCDTVMVLVNGILVSKPLQTKDDLNGFGYWRLYNSTLNLGPHAVENATLELVVENWGRNNFGKLLQFVQYKGLWQGQVFINNQVLSNWEIIPLEFRTKCTNSLAGWQTYKENNNPVGPALYHAVLMVNEPRDTYIDMRKWTMGIVIVNGFVLGRHAIIGPQYSLYLPRSFLNYGENDIIVFEHFRAATHIRFATNPIFFRNARTYF